MFLARVIFHPYCQYIQTGPLIPTHCRYRQLSHLTTLNETHTHTHTQRQTQSRCDVPGQVISQTQNLYLTTLTRDIYFPGGIRTRNPSRRAATDLRLRPRGHRDFSVHAYVHFIIRGLQRQSVTACPEAFRFYRLFRPKDMTGRIQQARTNCHANS